MKKLRYVTSVKGFYKRFVKIIKHFLKFLSIEAAKFNYENRYAAYEECKQPCGSMNVYTSLKYKILNNDPSVRIIFPRYITITKEKFVHSFITLGEMLYYYYPTKVFFLNFSCRTGWLSWHDPRI